MNEVRRSAAAALEVRGLDVYYGHSHALQGVDLTLEAGVFSVVGRNGMGKTTLCKAIMGLVPVSGGSIRVRGDDITRRPPAHIARLGVGYVPQGRRLWRSLSVDEHLQLAAGLRRGAWTVERIYETFPRLAERKDHGGGQLSGGEQQMLAISRALLTNPQLLIMDEPTEGLAPVIVAQVEEMLVGLGEDGDMSVLVIEQNIGVATAVSRNVAIMVNGRINRIIDSARLAADRGLQQRLLGVGLHAELEPAVDMPAAGTGAKAAPQPSRPGGPIRVYISNPTPPTRWSQPVPIARIEAAARTLSTQVARLDETARRRREPVAAQTQGPPVVLVVGTLDTKGTELRFIRDIIAGSGLRTRLVDVSTSGRHATSDVSAQEIALNHGRGGSAVFGPDRGAAVTAMAEAFASWLRRQNNIAGVISAGGSGAASLVAPGMRTLPVGVPKLIISSVASGDVGPYVGPADITMMHSVTDVQGLNSISRAVLANGAHALAGMVRARLDQHAQKDGGDGALPSVGITMFGVTTPAVQKIAADLREDFECLVFHATGVGGRSMEKLVDSGQIAGVIDLTTTEICDLLMGGVFPATDDPLRRHHPQPPALCRLGGRARHGEFRRPGHHSRALPRPQIPRPQPPGHPDADHGRGKRTHGPLDRRSAQPDGRPGALLPARGRRLRARRARTAILGSRCRCGAVPCAGAERAADRQPSAHPRPQEHQRSRVRLHHRQRVPDLVRPHRGAPETSEVTDGPV
ncbi:ABC-type branched-subunit amino acid transport system ATPase component [Bradyrhizobium sp. i1.3.1]